MFTMQHSGDDPACKTHFMRTGVMDVKYQIFVSSTFDDLKEERRKVIEQILNLGHIPVGMELFQAGDETQWDLIRRRIAECDYYIVIVAERYGMDGPNKKSYTRMEYEFALKIKVPTIAFLLHKDARSGWPQDKIEFMRRDKIDDFRGLCQKKIVQYWINSDDLAAKVVTSLTQQMRDKPRVGWIRANRAASSETINELAKLSEEKRELQICISELKQTQLVTVPPSIVYLMDALAKRRADSLITIEDGARQYKPVDSDDSMLDLFMKLSRTFASCVGARSIERAICKILCVDQSYKINYYDALAELLAIDLLQVSHITDYSFKEPRSDKRYQLTNQGKMLIMYYEMRDKVEVSIST